jgi:hypothetical protein
MRIGEGRRGVGHDTPDLEPGPLEAGGDQRLHPLLVSEDASVPDEVGHEPGKLAEARGQDVLERAVADVAVH